MNHDNVLWAAQADLVLLTVEMLRAPIPAQAEFHRQHRFASTARPAWTTYSDSELCQVIDTALPAADLAGREPLQQLLRAVMAEAVRLPIDFWNDEYWRLFDASLACPINQAAYIRRDKGAILGDVAGFYRAFGWSHVLDTGERPDHLLTQLEFVSVLLAMRAQATTEDEEQVVETALSSFARLHMHDWLPSFCQQLVEATQLAYFAAVSEWLSAFWEQLSNLHAWPRDEAEPNLKPQVEPENPYECAANGIVQIGEH